MPHAAARGARISLVHDTDTLVTVATVLLLGGVAALVIGLIAEKLTEREETPTVDRIFQVGLVAVVLAVGIYLYEAMFVTGTGDGGDRSCRPGSGPVPDMGDC